MENENAGLPTPNGAYKGIWKQYTRFVDNKRATMNPNTLGSGPLRISRVAVDMYFQDHVNHLKVCPKSAQRHATAINWFAKHHEMPGRDPPL
jgi:hypothetical protein